MTRLLLSPNQPNINPTLPPNSQGLLQKHYLINKTINLIFPNIPYSPNLKTTTKCSSSSSLSSAPSMHHEWDENIQPETLVSHDQEQRPLSEMWKEMQGLNNWEGLLDPTLNPHLRQEIIRYGEFAQASYDSFDFDPHSKYCGTCKYQGAHFFENLDMADRGYQISRYLYATSNINLPNFFQKSKVSSVWSTHANWMGYVAVATDVDEIKRLGRRDIVIAWRGTVTYLEWIYDLKDILRPAYFCSDPSVKIESGFHELYTKKEDTCKYCSFSAREQVLAEIKRLRERYEGEEISITITGHSLGAALAILSAYDIAEMGLNVIRDDGRVETKIPITVYSFSGPRVGNLKFKERCDELGVKVLRVINVHDKVPTVPGIIANEKFRYQKYIEDTISFPWSYAHVGVELALDHTQSPFLKPTNDFGCAHNLEAHLHLVDGYHGKGKKFCLVTKRDIALVNKSCDFLKSQYGVPPHWRQDENKGMVRNRDGRWVLPERPKVEAHPPDMVHHIEQLLNKSSGSQLEMP
ncbi:putative carboxylic ester hydrolase [Rosa chinensis]|uniref:Putative carboxylic ester hydrolase n=1 Tax=Rosa chinensis TaxID=74649 RepID=A0A2P6QFQ5_ROSCH|nr:phospholipase A1-Igamma3, chloroplastic [Rosa chinensis]PRQ33012.1 putative carboxylic ester hydrolase [Rosa chinensis]